ncbi:MAG: HAMP domain-containing protein [Bacteroidetes bacterium]|nr:HAMP domain-containing protein [Bacteroidota bacterium]MBS1649454.1 HAMP domain-containing protein [Bacteroidota bacterium]
MPFKLKQKVTLGVFFLFTLLILVGSTSFFYLNRTISNQRDILKNNYETLQYSKNMLHALDIWNIDSNKAKQEFEKNLHNQEINITEPGEDTLTKSLLKYYTTTFIKNETQIRYSIIKIMQLNLQAIIKKNQTIQQGADDARFVITILLTICALIGFTFAFNFPDFIATPIIKLTEGIKAIAAKNYSQRIHLSRKDEFGDLANAFNYMAEELDKYEHSNLSKILFEKQRAETVINSLKDASIGIDNNGIILFVNQQALQLLNIKEINAIGKNKEQLAAQNNLFNALLKEQNNQPFKVVIDNKEQFFSKEIIDITNANDISGIVIVIKNITTFKELDVAKTNFIATISHELKTPLASSDFSLKLLENEQIGTLNKEQKELIQSLKEDNQRLLKILSELLDLSQVESGKIKLTIKTVQPLLIVERALKTVTTVALEKNIQFNTIQNTNASIKADEEKTSWVLINLLTNAIKYSAENSTIQINIRQKQNTVEFSIKDTASGIPQEYLSKVFDRFFKVPGTEKTGAGLGLAISKEFIEAMGGTIGVESKLKEGSRFYFNLPIIVN